MDSSGEIIIITFITSIFLGVVYWLVKKFHKVEILRDQKALELNSEKINIEEERAKDEAILRNMGEGFISTDEYAKITKVNIKAEEILGFSEKELIGRWIIGAFAVYDEKGIPLNPKDHPMVEALIEGKLVLSTLQFAKKDFTKFIAGVAISPIIFNQKPIGAIIIFRDITHEKEIDRMKSEFISLASHQLRTPLSAIKWYLEMLLNGDAGALKKEQKEMLQYVDQSNERMISLVNSLLNVSRIESGRIIIDPVPTDLAKLIKEVEIDLKGKMEEKRQKLIVSVNKNLTQINIDPQLIRQVFMNLLTNSIKYTPQGGEISVFVSRKGNQIISQITDTGYGIPKTDYDKVYKKFYRGENIIKVETDGNGLGMYLVKAIIDSSGGKIWFESEEGKGTTFWFSIPLSGMVAKTGEVSLNS